MSRLQIDQHARVLDAWHTQKERSARSGPPWRRSTTTACGCVPTRRGALTDELNAVLDRWMTEHPGDQPAEGTELVFVLTDVVPLRSGPRDRAATVRSATRRLVGLTALRWLPVGLTTPITVLLAQARGLSLAEIGLLFTVHGVVVMALELPTGGLADVLGRRPVVVAGALLHVVSCVLFATAT